MIRKKLALGLDPRVGTGFPKRSCSTNREVTKQKCDARSLAAKRERIADDAH
jgi:hypothetical protein